MLQKPARFPAPPLLVGRDDRLFPVASEAAGTCRSRRSQTSGHQHFKRQLVGALRHTGGVTERRPEGEDAPYDRKRGAASCVVGRGPVFRSTIESSPSANASRARRYNDEMGADRALKSREPKCCCCGTRIGSVSTASAARRNAGVNAFHAGASPLQITALPKFRDPQSLHT